jgi:DNA-binding winged helix-turn-helix (wHTH) protein
MSVDGAMGGEGSPAIVFSSFRLDRRSGQLTCAGTPIPLRAKTWAVLLYLAERPGVLVTREELLDAVWPGVAVTSDTLTQSIGELRRALNAALATPPFIETVHRRGVRFVANASTAPVIDATLRFDQPSAPPQPH